MDAAQARQHGCIEYTTGASYNLSRTVSPPVQTDQWGSPRFDPSPAASVKKKKVEAPELDSGKKDAPPSVLPETPVYETTKQGPSHEPVFRSSVTVGDATYESLPGFLNRKAAEQSAAEIALIELAKFHDQFAHNLCDIKITSKAEHPCIIALLKLVGPSLLVELPQAPRKKLSSKVPGLPNLCPLPLNINPSIPYTLSFHSKGRCPIYQHTRNSSSNQAGKNDVLRSISPRGGLRRCRRQSEVRTNVHNGVAPVERDAPSVRDSDRGSESYTDSHVVREVCSTYDAPNTV